MQAHHDGLGFRVAKAAVVLDDSRLPGRANHQARIEETGVGIAFFGHAADRGQDDLVHDSLVYVRGDHRSGRVGTHATGIGAGVAFANAFVILAGGHGQHVLAINHYDKAGFFAGQKLFDNHSTTGFAKGVARQHIGHGVLGLLQRFSHYHALARGQPVGLYYNRCAVFAQVGQGRLELGKVAVSAGGDIVARQEIFGEGLGAFQLGSALARAEAAQLACFKIVDHTADQRRFRADDSQAHVVG